LPHQELRRERALGEKSERATARYAVELRRDAEPPALDDAQAMAALRGDSPRQKRALELLEHRVGLRGLARVREAEPFTARFDAGGLERRLARDGANRSERNAVREDAVVNGQRIPRGQVDVSRAGGDDLVQRLGRRKGSIAQAEQRFEF